MVAPKLQDRQEDDLPDKDVAKEFYAKYEPKEILGRGISSTVRRCIDKETGEEFAAKIIDISSDTDGSGPTSLYQATKREIEVLKRVAGHPYIIELHDVFESTTFIFLVLELCRHGELFDYLTSVVALSEKKTKSIMKQLLEAVEFIHSKGIVHRDLKPENILLDDDLNVKVTDFGFATQLAEGETLTELCGTPGYLAPELLKASMYESSEGYDKQVDIWACGVIMYTLLVGFPPFWHRKQMVMLRNIMEGKYEFCSPEWDDITEAPKDLISKLLVVDPKKRLTASQALDHCFFKAVKRASVFVTEDVGIQKRTFNAKKTFQFGILCVRALVRIRRLRYTPEPLSLNIARTNPYRIKTLRKVIDGCAFRVYCHWVKKGEMQNRAALFENHPKIELRQMYEETQVAA
ncbi:phosphorylase b kinase gamma catalytic chain, liver/testis isoform isoform X2 [Dermacentor silvarum]|uniref:phosphorylase b kinase gamma catalytic chain, liver/testis isoform isoform X2 n=1 Tax=Dermacentor silvarum TaxID=543639 RepID=UPI001897627D|nr:phosphorylase b kinase gamma catalytic chain, liver/testis isoform isoform X2 [Dermacentor silvarum]XP_049520405.1 phosphorylase b kinase gamma catalytic chain, liver/testis isoform isoform X2 [Dermacentor silvarum]XP_049520406.1 phosphorylase b kinase gamma catalytic chain, liver/testis isoform isoform X2 [Dermacentor silvarum]XP_049520407.1 phosphorylase b kinase gamma catalytic chain, liver/testis isoform isoform X2 [Dermacentor silvarum]